MLQSTASVNCVLAIPIALFEQLHVKHHLLRPRVLAHGRKRGRSHGEQPAISGSLSLLSNLVMGWNTQKT